MRLPVIWVERNTRVQLMVTGVMFLLLSTPKKDKYRCKITSACVCPSTRPPKLPQQFKQRRRLCWFPPSRRLISSMRE